MVNHAELTTDQFVRQIGIDAARIEQVYPVAQLLAMQLDDLEFSLRIAIKLGDLVKRNERTFEKMAKVTCCKGL